MMNYSNRNASSVYTKEDLAKGYLSAVSMSAVVSLGVRQIMNWRFKGNKSMFI